jgi:hypothetical protein
VVNILLYKYIRAFSWYILGVIGEEKKLVYFISFRSEWCYL